jgi:iron complex transport system substrate-binding protein
MSKYFLLAVVAFFSVFQGLGANPQRIVSLAPSLTKCIVQLDAVDKLVGCSSYCNPGANNKVVIVATAIQVYLEKLIALKPDLVIATGLTDAETINSIKKFGIEVKIFPSAESYPKLCDQFQLIGELVGKKDLAKEIVARCNLQLDELSKNFSGVKRQKMFFQIGAQPLFTVLSNTFMDDFITLAGGENIAKGMKIGTLTREFVLIQNPEVIIITSMGITGAEEKKVWENYKELAAAKEKKIFIVDADGACSPTPIDFVETFKAITTFLKPAK